MANYKLERMHGKLQWFAFLLFIASCATTSTRRADEEALLALHENGIDAHRTSNADRLLANAAPDAVIANRGQISRPTLESTRARFSDYLGRTRFTVYRDQVPPVVKVSKDGTLGWVIAQVEAKGEQRNGERVEPLEFVSAWIELYEKRDGRWVSIGNVSNFR